MIISVDKLTKEQQKFAADHHYLINNFLRARNLKKDEYYDIVVFGFLRAVRKYFRRTELKKYAFSTIALWSMKSDLYNHYRRQGRKKRTAHIVSLDSPAYSGGDMTIGETAAASGAVTDYLDAEILWDNITANLPDECVEVLRMRTDGYSNREIAKDRGVRVKDIDGMIEQIRGIVSGMRLAQP